MSLRQVIACVVMLQVSLFAGTASAKDEVAQVVKVDTRENFAAAAATTLRSQTAPGGKYEFVKLEDRTTVEREHARITGVFEEAATVASMPEDAKVEVLNSQESINAILTRRDRDRLICERVAPIGSNIPVKTCRSYGQIESDRQRTQKFLTDTQRTTGAGKKGD